MRAILDNYVSYREGTNSNQIQVVLNVLVKADHLIISIGGEAAGGSNINAWCISCTVNGVAAKLVARDGNSSGGTDTECHIYELHNDDGTPFTPGSYTILATYNASIRSRTITAMAWRGLKLLDTGSLNVAGDLGTDVAVTNGNGDSTFSKNITTTVKKVLLIENAASQNAPFSTITDGGTILDIVGTGPNEEMHLITAYREVDAIGTYTFSGPMSNPECWGLCMKAFPIASLPGVQIIGG